MAEKTDEEIVNEESGLESKITDEEVLAHLNLGRDRHDDEDENETLKPLNNKSSSNENSEDNTSNVIENEDKDSSNNSDTHQQEEIELQKKQPKIFRILIAIAATLYLVLIIGLILYVSGFFNSPVPVEPQIKKVEIKKVVPEVIFNEKEIDKNELNKKLTMLTKKEIMSKDELEAEEKKIADEKKKKEEEIKLAIEKKKKEEELKLANQLAKIQEEKNQLLEQQKEIKKQQEEILQLQAKTKNTLENKINGVKTEEKSVDSNNSATNETNVLPTKETSVEEQKNDTAVYNSFLSFINVATVKGELYKSYLDDIQKYDKNISLCRDVKNRIEIYFGPYDSQKEREKVYNLLIENGFKEAYLVDFTKEEYDKRCKY